MNDRKARIPSLPRNCCPIRALGIVLLGALLLAAPASAVWAKKKSVDISDLTIAQAMHCVMEPKFDIKLGAAAEGAPEAKPKPPKESHVFAITAKGKVLHGWRPEGSDADYHWSYLDPIVRMDENGKSNFIALNRNKGDLSDFITSRVFVVSFSRDQVALANTSYFAELAGGTASAAWNKCNKIKIDDGEMELKEGFWSFL